MQIPAEPVSRLRLYMKGTGWLTFFALPFALAFTGIAMVEGRTYERLERDGAVTEARILGKDYKISTDSDGDRTTTYYVDFAFTAGGQRVEDRDSVGRGFWTRVAPDDRVPVRYWRPDPGVNEIEPGATAKAIWITKLLAVIFLTATGFWAERCWRKAARAARVRDRGVRRRARVTEHVRTSVRINNSARYRLKWRDAEGGTGASYMHRAGDLGAFPVGSQVTVYADPDRRLAAVWEGDVGPPRAVAAVRR